VGLLAHVGKQHYCSCAAVIRPHCSRASLIAAARAITGCYSLATMNYRHGPMVTSNFQRSFVC